MDLLQADLEAAGLPSELHILGVNGIGLESENAAMYLGRSLPWLQDEVATDVWTSWSVTYRDVIILDADNRVLVVYNLTDNDLGDPAHYAELRALLVSAAGG